MDLHRRSLESTLSKPFGPSRSYVLPFIVHATNRTVLLPRRGNGFVWGLVSGRGGAPPNRGSGWHNANAHASGDDAKPRRAKAPHALVAEAGNPHYKGASRFVGGDFIQ